MKELLIMAKSLGGGGSEVALIELINALPEELYNITLVLLDSDNEYAYRLKKNVNIIQLTFNSSFAKSLVSMYAFPAKVLKKLSVNSFVPYYDLISNCVTNVFEKTYDIAVDFYGYGSFVTAFLAKKIQAKKKATWIHDEKPYWMKSVQKYLCEYDKIYGVSQAVVDAFCREYPHYKDKAAVFYNVIDIEAQLEKVEGMLKQDIYSDKDSQSKLNSIKEGLTKQNELAKEEMKNRFEYCVGTMQGYQEQASLAKADAGNRMTRLNLTKSRLTEQKTNFTNLKSENEDIDLEEVVVGYSAAQLVYNASLTAASKVIQQTLLDFL